MKKYAALLALAGIILAAGCTSSDTSSASIALDPSETEIAVLEPDKAFLTREAPSEPETPPQELCDLQRKRAGFRRSDDPRLLHVVLSG